MAFDEALLDFGVIRMMLDARCVCDFGRRRVAEMRPTSDRARLEHEIAEVREMLGILRSNRIPPISDLRDVGAVLRKAAPVKAVLDPMELLGINAFLETAGRMRNFFIENEIECPTLSTLAGPLHHVPALHRSIDEKIQPNAQVRDSASETLQRLRREIAACEDKIKNTLMRMIREFTASGDLQDDFFTLRNDRYVLPVKSSNRSRVKGIIHDTSNSDETVFIEPFEILEESTRLADLQVSEREEIFRILSRVSGHVRDELNVLMANADILAAFDLIFAKAKLGAEIGGAFPQLGTRDRSLRLVEAHHPILRAADASTSRPLNLELAPNDHVLVITGPNAGGKTTALKTLGLIALMVQTAVPPPISFKSVLPIFSNILAVIGDEQSVAGGESTFSANMRRMVALLKRADRESLVLIDELGTATDPGEGGALAIAIIEELAACKAQTIVSTHLSALKVWAHQHDRARNASFRLNQTDHRPTFQMTMDVPGISEALVIAQQVGIPEHVIERARSLRPQGEGDVTALILSLQEKEARLTRELAELDAQRKELDESQAEADTLREQLAKDRKRMKGELVRDKERAVQELRAAVEKKIANLPSKRDLLEAREELEQQAKSIAEEAKAMQAANETERMAKLRKGDSVMITALNEIGIVEEILEAKNEARVIVKGKIMRVSLAGLGRAPATSAGSARKDGAESAGIYYRRPTDFRVEIDLHGMRVAEALNAVDQHMDNALRVGVSNVKLQHGQGTGALKRAIHEHLRNHPLVKHYNYAMGSEGAAGVTVVELK